MTLHLTSPTIGANPVLISNIALPGRNYRTGYADLRGPQVPKSSPCDAELVAIAKILGGITYLSKEPPHMKVWIDQDLCTGDGICVEIAPDVFALLDDGLAYVKDGDTIHNPGGPGGLATVPESAYETTIDSAEECPGECIFIEVG